MAGIPWIWTGIQGNSRMRSCWTGKYSSGRLRLVFSSIALWIFQSLSLPFRVIRAKQTPYPPTPEPPLLKQTRNVLCICRYSSRFRQVSIISNQNVNGPSSEAFGSKRPQTLLDIAVRNKHKLLYRSKQSSRYECQCAPWKQCNNDCQRHKIERPPKNVLIHPQ